MKTLFTLLLCASMTLGFAQARQDAATGATTQTAPTLTAKQKTLCKEWKLTATETWDLRQNPTDAQKGDLLNLMETGRYRWIYDGVAEGGTWTVDAGNKWITLTSDAGVVKRLQVLSQTDAELKVDYRDADGTHNILIYGTGTATPAPVKK